MGHTCPDQEAGAYLHCDPNILSTLFKTYEFTWKTYLS
ncbi:hypothetical protein AM1_3526 [Acaryochloris marina MBIC11017]|uniref:Uncharacterized protein n=1 Tax=Acaryochloris marina (strain MBIC 11017) TaxID=329726 RepID=B0C264_ACAM1|nr:hypothetical protein AM1_3526 [Acaryochloris marina MBIC11017]